MMVAYLIVLTGRKNLVMNNTNKFLCENYADDIILKLSALDSFSRVKFFSLLQEEFCFNCGYEQPADYPRYCQCDNDE